MGRKREGNVKLVWSDNFAYILGVIATDGNLSSDLRHICITSKDYEMVSNCKTYLQLQNKIGKKARGTSQDKKYYRLQFGDKNFFEFLQSIGITPKKSLTISALRIPEKYFSSFFLGCIDGDGCISISNHPESKHAQSKIRVYSASQNFLEWLLKNCTKILKTEGGSIIDYSSVRVSCLSFGKSDSKKIIESVYSKNTICLSRKREVAMKVLKESTKSSISDIVFAT